jgi:hypothetical protein
MTIERFEEAQAAIIEAIEDLTQKAGYTFNGKTASVDIDAPPQTKTDAAHFIYALNEALDTYYFIIQAY